MTRRQIDAVGYAAMLFTTAAPFFQAGKTYLSQSTTDLSPWMWIVQVIGGCVWLIYAVATKQGPVVVANVLTTIAALAVLLAFVVFR